MEELKEEVAEREREAKIAAIIESDLPLQEKGAKVLELWPPESRESAEQVFRQMHPEWFPVKAET